ncbi:MAG TPA: ABC transporter ATP-binding protein [Pirellulales bacterium]|nr:ABC transporter ATP-binding protein [Pirellulales bacterium]
MPPVITLAGITKRYGTQTALDRVSLDVQPGTVCALLGENGAGKTTAIRILLGLTAPDEGAATVLGHDSTKQGQAVRSLVGYVPERPTLYEWMKVSEIGWFTSGFYPSGFYQRYLKLAAGYKLPLNRKIKHLSKGMRAKVSLSLALAHEPELLILDEPTSGLDTLVRREFLEGMVDIAAAGRTVLLSSHQIGEVERVADVVAIIRSGKLLLVEQLDALKDQIRELSLTLADSVNKLPQLGGQILSQRLHRHQWQVLVRGLGEAELTALGEQPGVEELRIRTPSLEEMFVAYLQTGQTQSEPVPAEPLISVTELAPGSARGSRP